MANLSIQFQPTQLTLGLSVISLATVGFFSFLAWKRSGFRRSVLGLECLRVLIVALVLFILNQPESVRVFQPDEKPMLLVLVDQSKSMDTRDVFPEQDRSGTPITRREVIAPLLAEDTWASYGQRLDVVIRPFGLEAEGQETDIHTALDEARKQHPATRAIVLASDGDWNVGQPPVDAAIRLRAAQIPIFAIPVGSTTTLPDLDLVSFDVPTFAVAGKSVRIPLTVESSLPRDYLAQIKLKVSDGTVVQQQIEIKAMGRTSDVIVWKPNGIGDFTLELAIPEYPGEVTMTNNMRQAPISIREEKLKVLIIESLPRWEYRFLRNALSRDPGVELNCLLFHPGLGKVGGGNKDYIPAFPESREELSTYDVVFIGDVGVQEGQLTLEQCELLVGMVQQQATGLVLIPGINGNHLSLVDSPLEPLLPVAFDSAQARGWGSQTPGTLVLTQLGRSSLLTKLADTVDENMQIWESLPGFQWHAAIQRAKAGTDVLAVHQLSSNQFGRIPLLVTKTYGAGKVLFMGTDGAWRWRRGVEDMYHYRFWGQVVRWMAYQRNMAEGELMRLYYSPEQPQVGQTVDFSANVVSPGGEPLSQADVMMKIAAPSGRVHQVQLSSTGDQWGAFSGDFAPDEPGVHEISLRCQENSAELLTKLFVQSNSRERIGRPMRLDVIDELAVVTKGQVIRSDEFSELEKAIALIAEPPKIIQRVALWSHPWMVAILMLGLAVFWIGRKAVGVI